ncbi:DUF3108 domain-containing protein [Methyloligella sp. 2.7D]|uniref:DUF3108 domain-containing protein n=1 Tax=unclassified Methyloligella TaxID=2625955 RepID=UPI00157D170C|nr:DUF3108 domain-containing protein [Methyloligella sp. GL2]QKP76572.1 DUF3108 domain-containing protein [Methyloligella sp. GL2]
MALGGGLAAAAPSPDAYAADSLAENATIEVKYSVKIGSFNLGTFKLTNHIQGTVYRIRGDGRFSILEGLLYEWRGTTASVGRVTTAGIQPSKYSLSYKGGKAVEEVRMSFVRGAVSELELVPPKQPSAHNVPITAKQLEDALDPMSAAFLFARSTDTSGDLSICKQTVPVFDGRQRFDIKLSPKSRVQLSGNGTGYKGPAVVCQAKYIPVGGHRPDNPGVQMLSQTDQIEIWMVPMAGTGLYVPYKVVIPTGIGLGTAVATSFKIAGPRRASLESGE